MVPAVSVRPLSSKSLSKMARRVARCACGPGAAAARLAMRSTGACMPHIRVSIRDRGARHNLPSGAQISLGYRSVSCPACVPGPKEMLALPVKKSAESEEGSRLGAAVSSWIEREYGEAELSRLRSRLEGLDQARRLAQTVLEGEHNGEAVARTTSPSDSELSADGETNERALKALRRYAAELLSLERRLPNAGFTLKFECSWIEAWGVSAKKGGESASKRLARVGALLRRNKALEGELGPQSGKLTLERAATLFNLACAESAAGAGLDRSSEACIKAACRHFSRSAGIVAYLRRCARDGAEAALGLESAPRDLSPTSLELCEQLMLAQAQACYFEKAITDLRERASSTLKAGACAKLAAHAASCYWRARAALPPPPGTTVIAPSAGSDGDDAYSSSAANLDAVSLRGSTADVLTSTSLRSAADTATSLKVAPAAPDFVDAAATKKVELDGSWAVHCEFQARSFEAAASFWSAQQKAEEAQESGSGYGMELAHYAVCASQCAAACHVAASPASRVSKEAVRLVTALREHATTAYDTLKKDNASIYRERVPEPDELPKLKGHALAKPTTPEPWLVGAAGRSAKRCADNSAKAIDADKVRASCLRGLLPRTVKSAVVAHVEAAQRASRDAHNASLDADDLERAALASLGLPQALDELNDCSEFLTHGALPEPLASRARELPSLRAGDASSADALRGAHSRLEAARDKAAEAITNTKARFEDDNDDDANVEAARAAVSRMLGGSRTALARGPRGELQELEHQLAAGANTDAALVARLTDVDVGASLAALDEALDRDHRKATELAENSACEFGPELVAASAACRDSLAELRQNGEERHDAARTLAIAAEAEAAGAALDRIDALADAGLPLLAVDEPYDDHPDDDDDSQQPGQQQADEPPPLVPRKLFEDGSRVSFCADVSAAVMRVLRDRLDTLVAPASRAAAGATDAQKQLIDKLATSRAAFSTAARRDPAARAARDALARVADGARNFEDLALSLAEGASFYAELKRRADTLDAAPPAVPTVSRSESFRYLQPPSRQSTLSAPTDEAFRDVPPDYFATVPPLVPTRRPEEGAGLSTTEDAATKARSLEDRRRQELEDEAFARKLAQADSALRAEEASPMPVTYASSIDHAATSTALVTPAEPPVYVPPPPPSGPGATYSSPPKTSFSPPPPTSYFQSLATNYASPKTGYDPPPTMSYSPPPTTNYSSPPTTSYQPPPTISYSPPPTAHYAPPLTTAYMPPAYPSSADPTPSYVPPQESTTASAPLAGEDLVAKILAGSQSLDAPNVSNRNDETLRRKREADDLAMAMELDRQERAAHASAGRAPPAYQPPPPRYSGLDAPPAYIPPARDNYRFDSFDTYSIPPPSASSTVHQPSASGCPPSAFGQAYVDSNGPPTAFAKSLANSSQ